MNEKVSAEMVELLLFHLRHRSFNGSRGQQYIGISKKKVSASYEPSPILNGVTLPNPAVREGRGRKNQKAFVIACCILGDIKSAVSGMVIDKDHLFYSLLNQY